MLKLVLVNLQGGGCSYSKSITCLPLIAVSLQVQFYIVKMKPQYRCQQFHL
jgi:hypothetical protein